jgi:hypothetical protein
MGHLPHLRHEHPDRLVLSSDQQASAVLIGLARTWLEDRDGIAALLTDLAMWDNLARVDGHPDGTGHAEHARDDVAAQLLAEAGGADFHLRADRDRHAAHQARRTAEEARRMADALDAHAHRITVEVEDAEDRRSAERDAELAALRGQLGHSHLGATLAYQQARPA